MVNFYAMLLIPRKDSQGRTGGREEGRKEGRIGYPYKQ